MKLNTIQGTYGSHFTPCLVFTAETSRGTWYAVEGSQNVNLTPDTLEPGVDVETVTDTGTFTWPDGIDSEETLEAAIED